LLILIDMVFEPFDGEILVAYIDCVQWLA
jgi:hypothetical protein